MTEYTTKVVWTGSHTGELNCSNGARMPFSAPADMYGELGILTPEDAFVGALNSCFMLMFIWATERLKVDLISYDCEAIGQVKEFLDRTSIFEKIVLHPKIMAKACEEKDIRKALKLAKKYSLIWQSIKSDVNLEPTINIMN